MSNSLNTKNVTIPANGSLDVSMSGSVIKCLTSTGAAGAIVISMDGGSDSLFDVLCRYRFGDKNFSGFSLRNTTGADVTLKIYVGDGDLDTGGDVTISGTVQTKGLQPDGTGTIADVTLGTGAVTAILPALAGRVEAVVVSDPTNVANIRMGDQANVGASRGALVQPGQPYTHKGEGALYGYTATAAQKVSGTYVTRS